MCKAGPSEVGEFQIPPNERGHSSLPPRRASLMPWVLTALVLGGAASFAWFVYLPGASSENPAAAPTASAHSMRA